MEIRRLDIAGLLLVTPRRHGDDRGFFSEVFRADLLGAHGVPGFVQDNHAASASAGVVRGLHYQVPPKAQGKLVRCARGAILDVVVDIRAGSPSFGRHVATELSAANWRQIWVPPGFAHGYLTLEPDCEVLYKTTDYYDPASERGLAWDDPALGVRWPLPPGGPILSPKDRANPRLAEIAPAFSYEPA